MTLQLRVGRTYRARNGDVVKIVEDSYSGRHPFLGDDGAYYAANGFWSDGDERKAWDLIEEISAPSPASELDEAIAKFEYEWDAAKQAMDKARWAAERVIQAARKAGTNDQG